MGIKFPTRVTGAGGIFVHKDREVPDTYTSTIDAARPRWGQRLSVDVRAGAVLIHAGHDVDDPNEVDQREIDQSGGHHRPLFQRHLCRHHAAARAGLRHRAPT